MKKINIVLTAAVLALSLCACGRKDQIPTDPLPATQPSSEAMTLPTIDPSMGTYIPDPTVEENSTDVTESGADSGSNSRSRHSEGSRYNGTPQYGSAGE